MLTEFFDQPTGQAVLAVGLLAVADFALGVFAAVRDNVFTWDAIAAWLRKTLTGRVLPIFGVLLVGYAVGGMTFADGIGGIVSPGTIITGIGLAAAASYVLEVIASMRESLVPKPATRAIPED
jgi:hypothetical protein